MRLANLEDTHPVPAPVPSPDEWDIAGARLWPLVMPAAAKGKLVAPADAEKLLANNDLEAVDKACAALQRWCWVRGMPPIDRAISHPRVKGALREVVDYDVFFEAMGEVVSGERFVLAYPWQKVREPRPDELAWARAAIASSGADLRAFRFLDLELELREADAARGRKRPVPTSNETWEAAVAKRQGLLESMLGIGVRLSDLRPPGSAPYPPTPPRVSTYSH